MKIKSIKFHNFKYVTKDKEMYIDLSNGESLILGGPNGYGKTTVFDALELLITGEIRHFNADLLNKGKESISVLANDISADIYVAAEFVSETETIFIERRFMCKENFTPTLLKNNELIDDDELYSVLGISKNLFDIGIYISQSDSLNFLQRKYKSRKESITGILDNSNIEKRLSDFKSIQRELKNKYEHEQAADTIKLDGVYKERENVENELKALKLSQEDIPYIRLFKDKEYSFDKEFFNPEDVYRAIISPVDDLIEFSKYKQSFLNKKRNIEIKDMVSIDKKIYIALFFRNEIVQCRNNSQIIDISNELLKLKSLYQQKNFYLNKNIIETLELTDENVQQINDLLSQKNSIERGMTDTQASLSKILKKRSNFLDAYNISVEESILPNKMCPLCGRESNELQKLFLETETVLKQNLGLIASQLSSLINKLSNLYELLIIPKVDIFLNLNRILIEKHNLLASFLQITTSDLNDKLIKENISFVNKSDSVDFDFFEENYLEVINKLNSGLLVETEVVSEELYIKLLRISLEYYSDIETYEEKILLKKKFYISAFFSNTLSVKFKQTDTAYSALKQEIKEKKSRFNSLNENISTIIKKYESARKQYQSSIVKNIATPMFIFSGRIIQNYPLGLGILIQVEDNAVVFKTGNIENDIFNNLSTGQLNGVVISLLLSIKEIFTANGSLNTLLIDDPLQTIDEISAISLIDLLSEHFEDTQIILSTHEDDKQFLMKKKYEQSGKTCKVLNMQMEYLSQ